MPTIPALLTQFDTVIRQKSLANSITTDNAADQFDSLAEEIKARGVPIVADLAALKAMKGDDTIFAFFPGRGFYKWVSNGALVNNDFDVVTSGVVDEYWTLILPSRSKGSTPNNYIKYFDLPSYVFSGGSDDIEPVEDITYGGEFITAAGGITRVGNYDQFDFTGGDRTSIATFNKFKGSDTNRRFRLRVVVVTLGSATSYVGIFLKNINGANDAGTQSSGMYVNLNNGTVFRVVGAAVSDITTGAIGTVSWNGPASAGDGIADDGHELEVIYEKKGVEGTDILTINNLTTGYTLTGSIAGMNFSQQNWNQFGNAATQPSILLAGVTATYKFIGFDCESTLPERPFLAIIGDSMASGYNANEATSLHGKLSRSLPYNVAQFAGPGLYYNSIAQTMRELLLQRPQYVLVFGWLPLYWGDFQNADPDYATFYASWTAIMKSIVAAGARIILSKYPVWPAGGQSAASQPNWAAFVDAEAATYNTFIVDLRTETFAYDGGAGFHLGNGDNEKVKNAVLRELVAEGVL